MLTGSALKVHPTAIEQRGVSGAEYAREENLPAQSLYGWRNRLQKASLTEQRACFGEIAVTQSVLPSRVLLLVGDVMLEAFEQASF